MNPSETNRATDDSLILIHKMNKYNFKEPYKVVVEIIEESEPFIFPSGLDNREQSSEPTFAESTQTTDICYQNTSNNQTTDTIQDCNNINVAIQQDSIITDETQNNSQTDSWITDLLFSENNNIPVVNDDPEVNVNISNYENELKKLSKNLINVLKAYSFYSYNIKKTALTKANQVYLIERYRYIKDRIFECCRDIVFRLILQQGSRFNEKEFLNNTTYLANKENYSCSYENVETVYKELISTCYRNNYIRAVRPAPAKVINKRHQAEQQNVQSKRCNNNIRSILPQTQNHLQHNDITPRMGYGSNSISQQTINNPPYYNTMQTTCNGSSSILNQTRNDLPYINTIQTTSSGSIPIPVLQGSTRNVQNQQHNSLQQISPNVPTTCIFKYNCPNREFRLDVNSELLGNVNKGNKLQNDLQVHDQSPTNEPSAINSSFANDMSHNFPNIQQEPTRSTSRDSGFMSPCNNQINDVSNNKEGFAEDHTAPYIIHVTSLHPDANYAPRGLCHICGAVTTSLCAGCFKYYYCSSACQTRHWTIHKYSCTNAR